MTTAALGPVFLEVWKGAGGVDAVRSMHEDHMRYVRRASRKTALFSAMLTEKMTAPDEDTRAFLETRLKDLNPHLVASALYIAATGLVAAVSRSVIGRLVLLKRGDYPTKVFGDAQQACEWVVSVKSPEWGPAPAASELLAAFESIRRGTA